MLWKLTISSQKDRRLFHKKLLEIHSHTCAVQSGPNKIPEGFLWTREKVKVSPWVQQFVYCLLWSWSEFFPCNFKMAVEPVCPKRRFEGPTDFLHVVGWHIAQTKILASILEIHPLSTWKSLITRKLPKAKF